MFRIEDITTEKSRKSFQLVLPDFCLFAVCFLVLAIEKERKFFADLHKQEN